MINGDPLDDISILTKANLDLVADPDKNFAVIMKNGKIFKNTVK